MDKIKRDGYKNAGLGFLIAEVLLLLSLFFPPAAIMVPFVLSYTIAMCGTMGGIAAVLCFAAGALLHPAYIALLAAAFLPVSFAAGIVIRKRLRMRHSVIFTSGAALAGVAAAIGVLWLFTQKNPIDYAADTMGHVLNTLGGPFVKMFYQVTRYIDILTGAVTQAAVDATSASEAIIKMQEMVREFLNYSLVSYIIVFSLLMGLLSYVIPRAIAKKRHADVVPVPAFSDMCLPPRVWLAFLISYLFAVVGESYGWASFDILKLTIYNAYGIVFIVQGLSFLDYIYKKQHLGTGVRVLLHAVIVLLLGSSFVLIIVGMFENISNLRKRLDTEGGTIL